MFALIKNPEGEIVWAREHINDVCVASEPRGHVHGNGHIEFGLFCSFANHEGFGTTYILKPGYIVESYTSAAEYSNGRGTPAIIFRECPKTAPENIAEQKNFARVFNEYVEYMREVQSQAETALDEFGRLVKMGRIDVEGKGGGRGILNRFVERIRLLAGEPAETFHRVAEKAPVGSAGGLGK